MWQKSRVPVQDRTFRRSSRIMQMVRLFFVAGGFVADADDPRLTALAAQATFSIFFVAFRVNPN